MRVRRPRVHRVRRRLGLARGRRGLLLGAGRRRELQLLRQGPARLVAGAVANGRGDGRNERRTRLDRDHRCVSFSNSFSPAGRPAFFFRELCQVLGSLHDTLAPLHSRDIQRRDHGRDAEDGRLGPLTFAARPATVFADCFRRRAGLSRTVPRVALNREKGTLSLNTRREARPLTPPAREKVFLSRLARNGPEKEPRVLTRFANAPASKSRLVSSSRRSGVFFRGPVARGVRAGRY